MTDPVPDCKKRCRYTKTSQPQKMVQKILSRNHLCILCTEPQQLQYIGHAHALVVSGFSGLYSFSF